MASGAAIVRGVVREDAEGFEPAGAPLAPMSPSDIVPRGQEFDTQGNLYRAIEAGLAGLAARIGEARLFIGPAFHQAGETTFGWPDLVPITDLAGASPGNFLLPHRRSAWIRFAERLEELADFALRIHLAEQQSLVVHGVSQALRRIASQLTSQIEAV